MKQEVARKSRRENKYAHDLFKYLPSEIMIDIFLRLPNKTIMRCKCVCTSWRDLLKTREFVKSHLSISVPGLAVYLKGTNQYKIVESGDEHRLNSVFSFNLPFIRSEYIVHSSINGLLFVCNQIDYALICNPITQEYIYIRLPSPLRTSNDPTIFYKEIYGFGVSKVSGQYKVVRINLDVFGGLRDCQVYTVGTGSWRRIELDDQLRYKGDTVGAFLNGNLHWLAFNKDYDHDLICCLDLESERCSTFSPPRDNGHDYRILSILGDYLCVCDTVVKSGVALCIDIRLMKKYGDEKSWKIKLMSSGYSDGDHCPIKVFKDGDMLMQYESNTLLYYSSKSEIIGDDDLSEDDPFIDDCFGPHETLTTVYTPSFLSLNTFAMENVSSF